MNYPPNSLLTGRRLQQITPKQLVGVPYFIGKKVDMMVKIKYIVIVNKCV